MTYTKEQLIAALVAEYEFICHDDFDPDVDISPEDYYFLLKDLSIDELIKETSTDDNYTLDQFMETYCDTCRTVH